MIPTGVVLFTLQLIDGAEIVFMNHNDQAGFRLETLSTHHQFTTPTVKGKDVLATYTDFDNPYPSILQTTSYNFLATGTTDEICGGVCQSSAIALKNPSQHIAHSERLCQEEMCSTV